MEKVLRRQFGASFIELDTRAGKANFSIDRPMPVDANELSRVIELASYTLLKAEICLRGHILRDNCEICAKDVPFLVVQETGQRLELAEREGGFDELGLGTPQHGQGSLCFEILEWDSAHPRLLLIEN